MADSKPNDKDDKDEFPDVAEKLAAPRVLTAFERNKQAQEAKKQRAKEEDAAALEAFKGDFGDDEEDGRDAYPRLPPAGPRGLSGRPRFSMSLTGRGRGNPAPSAVRPSALKNKKPQKISSLLGGDSSDEDDQPSSPQSARDRMEDIDSMPRMKLSRLPPSMTEEAIRQLLEPYVKVHQVAISLHARISNNERKSMDAIVHIRPEVPSAQVDKAATKLERTYLGCGYRLSIKRIYADIGLSSRMPPPAPEEVPEPFGAKKVRQEKNDRSSMRYAPPPGQFAPPDQNTSRSRWDSNGPRDAKQDGGDKVRAVVQVEVPQDLALMRSIHVITDKLLQLSASQALEWESLLMSRPEVQQDERFSFLYDSSSPAGVYYRWLLWSEAEHNQPFPPGETPRPVRLFADDNVDWLPPNPRIPFFDVTDLADYRDHPDWEATKPSSEPLANPAADPALSDAERAQLLRANRASDRPPFLPPLWRAKFAWLLATAPKSPALLTHGDVQGVSYHAVLHAPQAAVEVVDMMCLNVARPFAYTNVARAYKPEGHDFAQDLAAEHTQLSLVGLYFISDVLNAAVHSGQPDAWRLRGLFEECFVAQRTFARMNDLVEKLGLGKLKAQTWRNKLGWVVGLWEERGYFSAATFEGMRKAIRPGRVGEQQTVRAMGGGEEGKKQDEVEAEPKRFGDWASFRKGSGDGMVVDGKPVAFSVGGSEMEGVAAEEVAHEDPVDETETQDLPMPDTDAQVPSAVLPSALPAESSAAAHSDAAPVVAEKVVEKQMDDMFADSDEE